ncbi:tyrosinase [Seminavis robusta]|uniref:Tyrosinase n=1 Tax=Seminavis robusta TaxID=568900 RepID=A0A9N8ELP9_9STRA|nr:tyrosinase [Seminavis robusta]|eukprot:Sro1413_g270590.1 tyrosinase (812) ;mRNA; r:15088-17523
MMSSTLAKGAVIASFLTSSLTMTMALPAAGSVTEISSFGIPASPSGMFFDDESGLLYILCGTRTNGDHSLYAYTTEGDQRCFITIPQSVGMSRVDGFYITPDNNKAYIVDSQGPIYAPQGENYLGGSVYEVDWTNPCGCSSDGTCTESSVTWTPTVSQSWSLSASDISATEGGGNDEYFRNSGIVVLGDTWFGVNGVHPVEGSLTANYPKSIVQVDKTTSSILNTWSFDGSTVGHDVDMEGLTCGPDQCSTMLYVGDEYNYIYQLDLETGAVNTEWDLNSIVGNVPTDKGIESLTYAPTTGYFYAGIQQTAQIHVVSLGSDTTEETTEETMEETSTAETTTSTPITLSQCTPTEDFPQCTAPTKDPSSQRVRREIRSLSTQEWDKVVAAMWIMKTEPSMEAGKINYGDNFRTYDYFVVKHAVATTDSRGDEAHKGAHFITWHAAFVLEFENALLAIDPSIEAMPYWDETVAQPSVFIEDYFGVDPAGSSATMEVTTGKFANWPVSSTFSIDDWTPYMTDTSTVTFNGNMASPSILRGGENNVTAMYATRYGSGSQWESEAPSEQVWWGCTGQDVQEWNDWYRCIEQGRPSLHSGAHGTIGGRPNNEGKRGDFEDPETSPNGPIFMFHHANLDRNRHWWMMRNNAKEELVCEYYGFPVEGGTFIGPRPGMTGNGDFYGAHLNDVASSSWGFSAADLGFAMEGKENESMEEALGRSSGSAGGALLTHADLVCWMGPETALYTYDTNIACLQDSTACNSFQGQVKLPGDDITTTNTEVNQEASEVNLEASSATSFSVSVMAASVVFGATISYMI